VESIAQSGHNANTLAPPSRYGFAVSRGCASFKKAAAAGIRRVRHELSAVTRYALKGSKFLGPANHAGQSGQKTPEYRSTAARLLEKAGLLQSEAGRIAQLVRAQP
jgi:hypothetical protein